MFGVNKLAIGECQCIRRDVLEKCHRLYSSEGAEGRLLDEQLPGFKFIVLCCHE